MKKLVLFFSLMLMTSLTVVHASFPVTKSGEIQKSEVTAYSEADVLMQELGIDQSEMAEVMEDSQLSSEKVQMGQEKLITLLLWFFLGGLAGHRWYAGKPIGWNILFILTAGGCGVWAIVDLVNILTDNF